MDIPNISELGNVLGEYITIRLMYYGSWRPVALIDNERTALWPVSSNDCESPA